MKTMLETRWIPNGARIAHELPGVAVVYYYESEDGKKMYAIAFHGRAVKCDWHYLESWFIVHWMGTQNRLTKANLIRMSDSVVNNDFDWHAVVWHWVPPSGKRSDPVPVQNWSGAAADGSANAQTA
ncbi:MAG: hypothetical protein ABFD89_06295 [Bryobacteraceae bacterium]